MTYTCILKACAAIGKIDKGKQIHFDILRLWLLERHVKLGNALVDMYAKCGALRQAEIVLENLPSCNVISWNALLLGYVQNGQGQQALHCFEHMQHEGICPDVVTYLCILKACAMIGVIDKGKQIHDEIIPQGLLENDVGLGGALVDMLSQKAFDCFHQMRHEGIFPDKVTFLCILKACAVIGAIEKGKQIHDQILMQGLLEHHVVLDNALVDMYAKCNALHLAESVLEKLPSCSVVSWNALIAGYAQNGQGQQALDYLERIQDFEMEDAMKADAAFIGRDVSVTPLIGKLRLHIQGYVNKEDFFISPLKREDVILGEPWFDCLAASIKFPERKIFVKFMEKDMYINAQELGSTIPLVNDQAFDKSKA
ncbi:hypothetical protein L7F22_054628 [Adiantum nelumboides]|nr:hypothetical protein [Adiantum nelumboides]